MSFDEQEDPLSDCMENYRKLEKKLERAENDWDNKLEKVEKERDLLAKTVDELRGAGKELHDIVSCFGYHSPAKCECLFDPIGENQCELQIRIDPATKKWRKALSPTNQKARDGDET